MKNLARAPGLVTMVLCLVLAQPVPAQSECGGDCGGDGEVTVNEILALVNIALGSGDVSTCSAGDRNADGEITVDEIVAALQNALDGCPRSVTQTWAESDLRLVRSTCPSEFTEALEAGLAKEATCPSEITIVRDQVTAIDCEEGVTTARIGSDGVAAGTESVSQQVGDCRFDIELAFRADLRRSPTTIDYRANVSTSGPCPFGGCEVIFASTLTRE